MLDFNLEQIFSWQTVMNLIDIAIVTLLIYQVLKIFRNTRATNLFQGIFIIFLVKLFSSVLGLHTTEWIVDFVIQWSAIALIVIFQPELRKGLEQIGRAGLLDRRTTVNPNEAMVDEMVEAVQYMARRKIGALISVERDVMLDEYIATGIPLNSVVTTELLINIFIPNTPLHDGAVIIKNHEIASAASYLPLSENPTIPKKYGTRHRAAIGLSEETDAVTIAVSEETGGISVTVNGHIISDLEIDDFRDLLVNELVESVELEKRWYEELLGKFNKEEKDEA